MDYRIPFNRVPRSEPAHLHANRAQEQGAISQEVHQAPRVPESSPKKKTKFSPLAFLIVAVALTIGISAYYSMHKKNTELNKLSETKDFAVFDAKVKLMTAYFFPRVIYPEMADFLKALQFEGENQDGTSTQQETVKQLLATIELSRAPYSTTTDVVRALEQIAAEYPELSDEIQDVFEGKMYMYASPMELRYLLLQKLEKNNSSDLVAGIIAFDPDTLTAQTYGQYLQILSVIDERFGTYLADRQAFDTVFSFARSQALNVAFEKRVSKNKKDACTEPEILILGQLANAFARVNNSAKISICNAEQKSYAVFLPLATGLSGEPIDYSCFGTIPEIGSEMMFSFNMAYRQDTKKTYCTYGTSTQPTNER